MHGLVNHVHMFKIHCFAVLLYSIVYGRRRLPTSSLFLKIWWTAFTEGRAMHQTYFSLLVLRVHNIVSTSRFNVPLLWSISQAILKAVNTFLESHCLAIDIISGCLIPLTQVNPISDIQCDAQAVSMCAWICALCYNPNILEELAKVCVCL